MHLPCCAMGGTWMSGESVEMGPDGKVITSRFGAGRLRSIVATVISITVLAAGQWIYLSPHFSFSTASAIGLTLECVSFVILVFDCLWQQSIVARILLSGLIVYAIVAIAETLLACAITYSVLHG